jgi:hypothetical protein
VGHSASVGRNGESALPLFPTDLFRIVPTQAGTLIANWLFEGRGKLRGGWGAAAKKGGFMTKLELLNAERAKKFDDICALVARELGYGELSTMNGERRNQVEDEAEQYVEQWEETVEMRTSPTLRPITPLRRLLSQYHDLCERILDEREIEEGLWAHRRRTRRRRPLASF